MNGLYNFISDKGIFNSGKQKYLDIVNRRIFYIQNPEQEKIDDEEEKKKKQEEKENLARLVEINNINMKKEKDIKELENLKYDRSFNKKVLMGLIICSIIIIIIIIIFIINWNSTVFGIFLSIGIILIPISIYTLSNWLRDEKRRKELAKKYNIIDI